MRKILDLFPLENLEDYERDICDKLTVESVTVNSSNDKVTMNCTSGSFINPFRLESIRDTFENAYFSPKGLVLDLKIFYPNIKFDNEIDAFTKYSDEIFARISVNNHMVLFVCHHAKLSTEGDTVIIDLEKDALSEKVSKTLSDDINRILKEWFGITLKIMVIMHEIEIKDERDENYNFLTDDEGARSQHKPADLKVAVAKTPKKKSSDKSDDDKKNYRKPKLPEDPDIFYGHNEVGDEYHINDMADGMYSIVLRGMISAVEEKPIKNDRTILIFNITDFTDTISAKIFVKNDQLDKYKGEIKPGKFIKLCGDCTYDTFSREISISNIKYIKRIKDFRTGRVDKSEVKRVELHAHTQMSDLDAVTHVEEYVRRAFDWGHPAVAITDHGVVQAFPDAFHYIRDLNFKDDPEKQERLKKFKLIYGCEGYLVNDDDLVDENGNPYDSPEVYTEKVKKARYYHIILIAKNDLGRCNLYKLVSESHLNYFSRRPRIPKSLLLKNREGIIIGSACVAGELMDAYVNNLPEERIEKISELYDYYEVQPTGNNAYLVREDKYPDFKKEEDLQNLNKKVINLADKHNKLCVATCDVHYLDPEDEVYRRIIMANKGFADADLQPPIYFRTTEEMLREFEYIPYEKALEIVVTNTNKIADMVEYIEPVRPDKCPPVIENSDNDLREICYKKANSMYGDPLPDIVKSRLDKELNSIISNGYSVMYIIAQKLVKDSNDHGYMVGSRGSVGSSFVATMSGITEVNPLQPHYYCDNCFYSDFESEDVMYAVENGNSGYDLPDKVCPKCGKRLHRDGQNIPFETFLGFYGDKEPDIDLNFSGDYQSEAHKYTGVIFGEGHTFKAGTIGTLAEKTAFGYTKHYYEDKGIHKRTAEIERLAKGVEGVKQTTGQHPGGIVVLPHGEEIYTFTPVQRPANKDLDIITTHFDYHKIDHNLLKLDILGHDDPTMIRFLEDLTGEDAKTWPMDDPKVMSIFATCEALGVTEDMIGTDLGSLGIPELGTNFVMNMLRETKPKTFSDMIRISGLSHGTDVWSNNAQTLIAEGKCTLATAICTRDDIMTYLILKGLPAGDAFKIMEDVRKGKVAKKKSAKWDEWSKMMLEHGVPDWYIWSCTMIKYMFPKAHACAYVMMAIRIAYCKVYHPLAYYCAYFSIRAKDFDYEMMTQGLKHLQDAMDVIKDHIEQGVATPKEKAQYDDALLVREMYCRGFEFTPIDIYKVKATRFQIVDGKLMPSLTSIDGCGEIAAHMAEEAGKGEKFVSINEYKERTKLPQSVIDCMTRMGILEGLPQDSQMSFMDLFAGLTE
ncbi:MAG: PolC-type DNA polymerase III [Lachnospiraceae bacterium]|nr:PolC-type DNA polymerase III [Lachnospiraceae bacterium]